MNIPGITSGTSQTRNTGIAKDFDQFLYLLTTQLQNQDPLEPIETSEFTNQLVQFANVEQSIKLNDNVSTLIGLQHANSNVTMLGYIGKEVEAAGENLPLVDGKAKFKYAVTEKADVLTITIKDKSGSVIRDLTGSAEAGPHEISWDGKDNNGNLVDDDTYVIDVKAIKNNGGTPKNLDVYTAIIGRVNAINTDQGLASVVIGKVAIPVGNILSVREAKL